MKLQLGIITVYPFQLGPLEKNHRIDADGKHFALSIKIIALTATENTALSKKIIALTLTEKLLGTTRASRVSTTLAQYPQHGLSFLKKTSRDHRR